MQWLKRVGDLLDVADEKVDKADLDQLAREVADGAAKHVQKQVDGLDLGLKEGWVELKQQMGGDLKDAAANARKAAGDAARLAKSGADPGLETCKSEQVSRDVSAQPSLGNRDQRLADLQERIRELEEREAERQRVRDKIQARFDEVEADRIAVEALEISADESGPLGATPMEPDVPRAPRAGARFGQTGDAAGRHEHLETLRRELRDAQAEADTRIKTLEAELHEASEACEPLEVEVAFWRSSAERAREIRGLGSWEVASDGMGALESEREAEEAAANKAKAAACARAKAEEASAREELAARSEEHMLQLQRQEQLQRQLGDLMHRSDVSLEGAEEQRRQTRELDASLQASESSGDAARAEADEAQRRALEAHEVKITLELQLDARRRAAQHARTGVEVGECSRLRRELEARDRMVKGLAAENGGFEEQLRRCRAAATHDLERAVPLSSASSTCWRSIDGPTMRVVTLFMRSACIRRTFAIHLVLTYMWLFFLMFRLETHH